MEEFLKIHSWPVQHSYFTLIWVAPPSRIITDRLWHIISRCWLSLWKFYTSVVLPDVGELLSSILFLASLPPSLLIWIRQLSVKPYGLKISPGGVLGAKYEAHVDIRLWDISFMTYVWQTVPTLTGSWYPWDGRSFHLQLILVAKISICHTYFSQLKSSKNKVEENSTKWYLSTSLLYQTQKDAMKKS